MILHILLSSQVVLYSHKSVRTISQTKRIWMCMNGALRSATSEALNEILNILQLNLVVYHPLVRTALRLGESNQWTPQLWNAHDNIWITMISYQLRYYWQNKAWESWRRSFPGNPPMENSLRLHDYCSVFQPEISVIRDVAKQIGPRFKHSQTGGSLTLNSKLVLYCCRFRHGDELP